MIRRIANEYLTHYCIVREDLPRGVMAAQLIHAAGATACNAPNGTYAIALAVANERELRELSHTLWDEGVDHTLVVEEDQPYFGQAMAIGIPPGNRLMLKRFLKKLKLLK